MKCSVVHCDYLVLGGVSDEPLVVGEADVGGGGAVPLVVGDDLDLEEEGRVRQGAGRAVCTRDPATPGLLTKVSSKI